MVRCSMVRGKRYCGRVTRTSKKAGIVGTLVVALHAIVAALHGAAHSALGIEMSALQNVFINGIIVAAP